MTATDTQREIARARALGAIEGEIMLAQVRAMVDREWRAKGLPAIEPMDDDEPAEEGREQ